MLRVYAAQREDMNEGWVWLKKLGLPQRSIVRIKNTENGRTVCCEALQIDENFLREYNQPPRKEITDPDKSLVMNAWYRIRLGGLLTETDYRLEVSQANNLCGKLRASLRHPQIVVRLATGLGIISVALGLLGVVVGAFSLCS